MKTPLSLTPADIGTLVRVRMMAWDPPPEIPPRMPPLPEMLVERWVLATLLELPALAYARGSSGRALVKFFNGAAGWVHHKNIERWEDPQADGSRERPYRERLPYYCEEPP